MHTHQFSPCSTYAYLAHSDIAFGPGRLFWTDVRHTSEVRRT
jgi:hypothetical protein